MSTGFCGQDATLENVRLMKSVGRDRVGVKAGGGIRSLEDNINMLQAGALRIGTSNGVAIKKQEKASKHRETDDALGGKIASL